MCGFFVVVVVVVFLFCFFFLFFRQVAVTDIALVKNNHWKSQRTLD